MRYYPPPPGRFFFIPTSLPLLPSVPFPDLAVQAQPIYRRDIHGSSQLPLLSSPRGLFLLASRSSASISSPSTRAVLTPSPHNGNKHQDLSYRRSQLLSSSFFLPFNFFSSFAPLSFHPIFLRNARSRVNQVGLRFGYDNGLTFSPGP